MLRLNIYRIHLPVTLETFIHKLVKYQSNSISDHGIRNKNFAEDDYSGVFFQKIILNTQNFGDDQTTHYEYYQNFYFEVISRKDNIYLIVYDAPKSLKKFFNIISDIAGIGFYFFDDLLNLEDISYNKSGFVDFKVIKAKITNISILNKSTASMEIQSINNAVKDFDEYSTDKNRKIVKIKVKYYLDGVLNNIEISNKGNFTINNEYFDRNDLNLLIDNFYAI
ncbi:hypothetical protein ACT4VW_00695 [Acinetobacter baumannii]|uniref:hypothetical protein n=1 Tax=Acinetobacter baumannii TaxID=470 RepID=UPI0004DB8806|nr:hypothetical protein [Acinetobacter baumannii]MDC5556923.1 hypothetical protein [Acinetobacter baumannii]MDO7522861.1 hypothetical protein [Acinetobacter baumannii]